MLPNLSLVYAKILAIYSIELMNFLNQLIPFT